MAQVTELQLNGVMSGRHAFLAKEESTVTPGVPDNDTAWSLDKLATGWYLEESASAWALDGD